MTGQNSCSPCPSGTYAPESGLSACLACSGTAVDGATDCGKVHTSQKECICEYNMSKYTVFCLELFQMNVDQIHVRMVEPVWMKMVPILAFVFISSMMDKIVKTVSFTCKTTQLSM